MSDLLFPTFRQQALNALDNFDQLEMEIDLLGIFPHCARSPLKNQKICSPYVHAQLTSGAKGICFIYQNIDISEAFKYVGMNVGEVVDRVGMEVQIALVDAIFEHINSDTKLVPKRTIKLQGKSAKKAAERARYIASSVEAQKDDRVGVIGCVEPIVRSLVETGAKIRIADMHSVYQNICEIQIERDAYPIIEWATKLIVTGSALWTQTMGQILEKASAQSLFTVIFAMTGHNIAPHYLNYGASIVVSEHFPFYWFANTVSRLDIYHSDK